MNQTRKNLPPDEVEREHRQSKFAVLALGEAVFWGTLLLSDFIGNKFVLVTLFLVAAVLHIMVFAVGISGNRQ